MTRERQANRQFHCLEISAALGLVGDFRPKYWTATELSVTNGRAWPGTAGQRVQSSVRSSPHCGHSS
jgi:hypothetical protein